MKNKKALTVVVLILIIIVIIAIFFFYVDLKRVKDGKSPIFSVEYETVKDGGTKMYLGLGYKIIEYHTGNIDFGTIFLKYNNKKGKKYYMITNTTYNNIKSDNEL